MFDQSDISMPLNDHPTEIPSAAVTAGGDGRDSIRQLCECMKGWCGVHLDVDKTYLINSRLRPLMEDLQMTDYASLLATAQSCSGKLVRDRIIDALTTHETLFFRDRSPFEALVSHVIPEVRERTSYGSPRLRIWSAACSSGQEPYSIAIKLLESVPDLDRWHVSILATDVSVGILESAKSGIYQPHEVQRGIADPQRGRYFQEVDGQWQIDERVRQMVTFQLNDLTRVIQPSGPFDLIYCRNVLIYFEPEEAQQTLRRIASRLSDDGRLFVGGSEVLRDVDDVLVPEMIGGSTCYRRRIKDR